VIDILIRNLVDEWRFRRVVLTALTKLLYVERCTNTSGVDQFKSLRRQDIQDQRIDAEVSAHFGSAAEVSARHAMLR